MRQYAQLPECPRSRSRYVLREGHGVELEVGAFLFGLVRLLKPDHCVETGLFIGDSAEWIGKALAENGSGLLDTCDVNPDIISKTRPRLANLPVAIHQCHGKELIKKVFATHGSIDFVHVDSGSQTERQEELELLTEETISPLGIVAFHDACVGYGNLYDYFSSRDWPHLVIPSIVGVAAFQRPQ